MYLRAFGWMGLVAGLGACDGLMEPSDGVTGELAIVEGAIAPETAPNGRGTTTLNHPEQAQSDKGLGKGAGGGKPSAAITFHGGPVMLGEVHFYYIWYGDWAGNSASSILTDLASNLGGSAWWNINTSYTSAQGTALSNAATFAGATSDNYSRGTALSDADIQAVVASAINGGALPKDASGIYFVLTSADVNATSGFCTKYCGWHTHASIGGVDIKYSFVGNADRCLSSCAQQTTSPNGNAGADAMASIIAHEATEAATDPDLNAWYDKAGAENADKCAWTFGTTYSIPGGGKANMQLGARHFLIQQNWLNVGAGSCAVGR